MAVHWKEVAQCLSRRSILLRSRLEKADHKLLQQVFVGDHEGEHQLAKSSGSCGLNFGRMECLQAFVKDFENGFGHVRVNRLREEAGMGGKYIGEDLDSCSLEGIMTLTEAVKEQGKVFFRESLTTVSARVSPDAW